jgi:hypothetical protein
MAIPLRSHRIILPTLKAKGAISEYRRGQGDFEKDFYDLLSGKKKEISIECKSVQVLDGRKNVALLREYLAFLKRNQYEVDLSSEVKLQRPMAPRCARPLRPSLRSTRTAVFPGSTSVEPWQKKNGPISEGDSRKYLERFGGQSIMIDFKRTRNSRDLGKTDNKAQRLYRVGEMDIVAACLFGRALEWDFVYCGAHCFVKHKNYRDRFLGALQVDPTAWATDLVTVLNKTKY